MGAAKRRRLEPGPADEAQRALAWLNSYPKVQKWMQKFDILQLMEDAGGLVRVPNLLPDFVAQGALRILEGLPPGRWNDTSADQNYQHNNIAHRFWSAKSAAAGGGGGEEALEALLRAFSLLLPGQLHTFSAARYERGHHIDPHDDRAYTPVRLDTGEVVTCSRDVTVVYHLTPGWQESWGGLLVDLEAAVVPTQQAQRQQQGTAATAAGGMAAAAAGAGKAYVPLFNSAVFFRVPRYHSVTPLLTDRPRFSVFGWFLQPGQLYDLFTGEKAVEEQQQQQQEPRRQQLPAPEKASSKASRPNKKMDGSSKQRHEDGGQEDPAAAADPPQCLLAQRLLAKAAARQRRRQQKQQRQQNAAG